MKILIIEPDIILRNELLKALEHAGQECQVASDALTAFIEINESIPDLIITELKTSGHGGYEFMYELKSYPDLMNTKIIVYTTEMLTSDILRSDGWSDLEITEYFYKPTIPISEVVTFVQKL